MRHYLTYKGFELVYADAAKRKMWYVSNKDYSFCNTTICGAKTMINDLLNPNVPYHFKKHFRRYDDICEYYHDHPHAY